MVITTIGLAVPVFVRVVPPVTVQVTVYPVIADPPVLVGAVNAIDAVPSPGVAAPMVGAPGGPTGVAGAVADAALVPSAFVAVTEQEYVVPFVSVETEIGLAVPVAVRVTPPVTVQVAV